MVQRTFRELSLRLALSPLLPPGREETSFKALPASLFPLFLLLEMSTKPGRIKALVL